jgi:hypothetical protein
MWPIKKKKDIRVNIKLLAGLDQAEDYDPDHGIDLTVLEGTKLKKAIKLIELPSDLPISFIINGEKASLSNKLNDGDEVFCFMPFAGG